MTFARGKYVACVAVLVTVIDVFDTDLAGAVGNAVICVRPGPAFSSCLIIDGVIILLMTTRTCVDCPPAPMALIEVAPPAPVDCEEFKAIGVPLIEVATAPLLPTFMAPTADRPPLVTMVPVDPAPPPPTLPMAVGVRPLNDIPPTAAALAAATASIVVVLTWVILAATGFKENKFVTFVGFFSCMDGG